MAHIILSDADEIYERARDGAISRDDALYLMEHHELLFQIADELRRNACGDIVTYVINRNINFTNRCVGDCRFCAFRDENGYTLTMDEIISKVEEARRFGATEVCIQGGLAPGLRVEDYCEILEGIKSNFPKMHIHAFSPMEIMHMSINSGVDEADALMELRKSGLGSIPGTAAEILIDRVRRIICPSKLDSERWIKIVRAAHGLGIPTTSTMMYGHIETDEDRIDHILKIKEIQKETRGFTEFIPLPFMSKNNPLGNVCSEVSMTEHMKVHAISRVVLHGYVKNIQASWVKLGPRAAQKMLFFGANDLGGTLMEESISKSAGASHGEYMSPEAFVDLVEAAGRRPARRTTLYALY
jgi:FO synthase subunit 2